MKSPDISFLLYLITNKSQCEQQKSQLPSAEQHSVLQRRQRKGWQVQEGRMVSPATLVRVCFSRRGDALAAGALPPPGGPHGYHSLAPSLLEEQEQGPGSVPAPRGPSGPTSWARAQAGPRASHYPKQVPPYRSPTEKPRPLSHFRRWRQCPACHGTLRGGGTEATVSWWHMAHQSHLACTETSTHTPTRGVSVYLTVTGALSGACYAHSLP